MKHPIFDSEVAVCVSGLPGAMGLEIAAACLRRPGFKVAPFAMTGANMGSSS